MPKVHYLQSSFSAGVLDPRLAARIDIRQYYQGLSVGRNVIIEPMGGVRRRPGQRFVAQLTNTLIARQTNATATAPNGGIANNARDDDPSTVLTTSTPISTTNNYVVVHYDLGSAQTIRFADVIGIKLSSGSSTQFHVQYSIDNSSWTSLQIPLVDTTARSRRTSLGSPGVSARYWRVVRVGTADLGAAVVTLSDFLLWSESSTPSNVRLIPFSFSTEANYLIVLTDRTMDIYNADLQVAADFAPSPYSSAELAAVDAAQSANTMILVHEDHQPIALVRNVVGVSWFAQPIEFTGVPQFDFNDEDSPTPTDDIQAIAFGNFAEGNTFQLELGGARTGPISYSGTATQANIDATRENIRKAVQRLYTVGFSGVSVDYDVSDDVWVITFSGDSADNHPLIIGTPLSAPDNATIEAEKVQNGSPRREDVWSHTRGWPRTVTFHEGRLWFGGTKSLPQAYFGSVVNDFFNFEVGEGLDDDAVFGAMNTAQLNAVTALKSGRFLQLFTTGGEFRFTASPITPSDAPRNQTEYGTAQIKPVSTDGATVFVQRTRKVLRDFLYRYEEDAYSSVPLSALAPHLLNGIVDMAAWQGNDDDDANHVYIINGDGTAAVYHTLRSQEIAAFSQWLTEGLYKAVAVVNEYRFVAVRRELNGVPANYLELLDDSCFLDCSVQGTQSASATISGLGHLNGVECRVRADGFVLSNVTPANGQVTIDIAAEEFEIGIDWHPLITTMPLNSDFGNGDNYLRKKRVVKGRVHVHESLGILYNGRPLPDRHFDIDNFDEPATPFSGVHSLEESSNWDEGPLTQTFSQEDPLPFHILGVEFIVETS